MALPRCDFNEVVGRIDFRQRYTRDELRKILMDLKPHIQEIDRIVEMGENVMVFCHRGALRSTIILGGWMMIKTRNDASTVYKYMRGLRPCIEYKVEGFLRQLEQFSDLMWSFIDEDSVRPLPCLLQDPQEMTDLVQNTRYTVFDRGMDPRRGGSLRTVYGKRPPPIQARPWPLPPPASVPDRTSPSPDPLNED